MTLKNILRSILFGKKLRYILFLIPFVFLILSVVFVPLIKASAPPNDSGSYWCSNADAGMVAATSSESVTTWQECWTWCQENMTANIPLCQFNNFPGGCWTKYAPGTVLDEPITYGSIDNCVWAESAGVNGGYYGMPWPFLTLNPYSTINTNAQNTISGTAKAFVDHTVSNVLVRPYNGDENSWISCVAVDATFDAQQEQFSCVVDTPDNDTNYSYEVQVVDDVDVAVASSFYEVYHSDNAYLKSFFTLNNATQIVDAKGIIGNGENAIVGYNNNVSQVTVVPGYDGKALSFGGGRAQVPDQDGDVSFHIDGDKFSVEAWINPTDIVGNPSYSKVVSKAANNNIDDTWAIGTDTSGGLYCLISTTNETITELETSQDNVYLANEWTKIRCSYDSTSGILSAYINDVLASSTTVQAGYRQVTKSLGTVYIGNSSDWQYGFEGAIDNVAIYNHIDGILNVPTITLSNSDLVNESNQLVITGTTTSDTGTTITSVQSRIYQEPGVEENVWQDCTPDDAFDSQSEGFTCTTATATDSASYTVEYRSQDSEGAYSATSRIEAHTDVANTLVSYISMSNSDGFSDINGVLTSGSYYDNRSRLSILGKYGSAINFGGYTNDTNAFASLNDDTGALGFDGANKEFTVSSWVKAVNFDDVSLNQKTRIVSKNNSDNSGESWVLGIDASAGVYCAIFGSDLTEYAITTGTQSQTPAQGEYPYTILTNDAWNNIGCTYDSATGILQAILNGEVVGKTTIPEGSRELVASTNPVNFGGRQVTFGTNDLFFNNSIDDTSIYNSVLTYTDNVVPAESTNVAPTSTVTVSSEYGDGYFSPNAVDENLLTEWASDNELNPWIQLNWAENQVVNKIEIYDRYNDIDDVNSGTLTFSDGSTINVTSIPIDGSVKEVTFASKTISWVKFEVTGGTGVNNGLDEIKVFSTGSSPITDSIPPVIVLSYATTSDIYATTNFSYLIKGTATDAVSNISTIQYSVDRDVWTDCTCDSGTCTGQAEAFTCSLTNLDDNSGRAVYIRSTDTASTPNTTAYDDYYYLDLYVNTQPTNDLIGDWTMDSLDSMEDTTYHMPNAVLSNITLTNHVGTNDAMHFSGTSSYIRIPDVNSEMDFSDDASSFKADLWIKPDGANEGSYRNILVKTTQAGDGTSWNLSINPDFNLYAGFWGTDSNYHSVGGTSATHLTAGEWTHVIWSWNETDQMFRLQIDDNDPILYGYALTKSMAASNGPVLIGTNYNYEQNFIGDIDSLKIYNLAYTEAPVISIEPVDNPERVTQPDAVFHATINSHYPVASAEYLFYQYATGQNLDGKGWQQIDAPDDLTYDETSESVSIQAPDLTDGRWYLYIRATDIYGGKSLYNNSTDYASGWFTIYDFSTTSAMPHYRFTVEAEDTTPPDIYAHSIIPNPTTDAMPSVRGYVKDYRYINQGDKATNIATIEYRIDSGAWVSVIPSDGAFDSTLEEFRFSLGNLSVGDHTLEIKSSDISGNNTSSILLGEDHSNYIEQFTIINPVTIPAYEKISKVEDFTSHELQDTIFTDGVWGNGYSRLRQTMDFTSTQKIPTNINDFGSKFGGANVNMYPSIDGNLWVSTNQANFFYYNTTTEAITRYDNPRSGLGIDQIKEVERNGQRYLYIMNNFDSTSVYNINNTPENTSDDASIGLQNYAEYAAFDRMQPFGLDDTQDTLALYALVNDGSNINDFVVRIDTNDTLMDPTDDTFITWGRSDGLTMNDGSGNPISSDITGQYYDEGRGVLLIASYSRGIYVCTGANTPTNKSDDSCYLSVSGADEDMAYMVFPIVMDTNGIFWLGSRSINRLDINDVSTTSDDVWTVALTREDINLEEVAKLEWIPGTYPVGDELFFVTRQGHIHAFEYNYTYDDTLDDTNYDYRMPFINARMGGAVGFVMTDANTAWMAGQGTGLYKVDITRDYASSNVIEFLSVPPQGMLEVDHIRLDDISGLVSAGSIYSLEDLVTYEVSNDDGLHWYPITIGKVVNFPTSGYKLKFRMVFTKGSTPIVNRVSLNYYAFTDKETKDGFDYGDDTPGTGSSEPTGPASQCNAQTPGYKAPYIYQAIPESRSSIRLYFTDADKPMDHYALQYGLKSHEYIYGAVSFGKHGDRTFLVEHLKPNTTYYFQMRSGNGCATGRWSNEISAKTPLFGFGLSPYTPVEYQETQLEDIDHLNQLIDESKLPQASRSGVNKIKDEEKNGIAFYWYMLPLLLILLIILVVNAYIRRRNNR